MADDLLQLSSYYRLITNTVTIQVPLRNRVRGHLISKYVGERLEDIASLFA